MTSREIENIICRDSGLPGLPTVFDTRKVREALTGSEDAVGLDSIELDYIRYKPMVRALALFQCRYLSGAKRPLVVIAHNQLGWKKRVETEQLDDSPSPTAIHLPPEMCSLEWFPRDRQLKQIAKLFNPAKTDKILNGLNGAKTSPSMNWQLQTQSYKPRRRFVAKAVCADTALSIKCYTKEDFESAVRNARLTQTDLLRDMVPRTIAWCSRYRILAFEWLQGEPLSTRLTSRSDYPSLFAEVGKMLKDWHARAQQSMPGVTWRHQGFTVAAMNQLVEDVSWLLPEMRERLSSLSVSIVSTLTQMEAANDLIHGDFYAKQIIHHDGKLRLIDFDETGRGHRYQDIGSFVGQLYWNAISTQQSPCRIDRPLEAEIESFLHGYEPNTDVIDWTTLKVSIVMGILRCLPHAFRRGLKDWPVRMEQMLDAAERWLSAPERGPVSKKLSGCSIDARHGERDESSCYMDPARMDIYWHSAQPRQRWAGARVEKARMIRYKPGQRLLVQYTVKEQNTGRKTEVLGKTRFGKPFKSELLDLHAALQSLRPERVIVPRVVGTLPQVNMWLQEKLDGHHVFEPMDPQVHRQVGSALAKLHRCGLTVDRCHTLPDEHQILHAQYAKWLLTSESWIAPASEILRQVQKLSRHMPNSDRVLIHRDFYFDQVLIVEDGVGLLDWDLAAMGPPELDVGNYLAHLDEYGLRFDVHSAYCHQAAEEFLEGYRSCRPAVSLASIAVWRDLSFARLIAISQRIPSRVNTTERMLEVCLDKLSR